MNFIRKFDMFLSRVEGFTITMLLSIMILMAFSQAVLRNLFHSGIPWADIFLRNLVLWVCFIGASLATREKKHISIDVLSRFLSPQVKKMAFFLVNLVSAAVCGFLASAAWQFMVDERSGGGILFGNVPTWHFLTIVPVSLCIMGVRFFLHSLDPLSE